MKRWSQFTSDHLFKAGDEFNVGVYFPTKFRAEMDFIKQDALDAARTLQMIRLGTRHDPNAPISNIGTLMELSGMGWIRKVLK